jgi:ribosome biogenesis GTPase
MIDLSNYGFAPDKISQNSIGIPARIAAVHKDRYALICEQGETYGRLKSSAYYGNTLMDFPTTGDFVMINYNPDGDSQIIKTLDRKTKFSRNDFSGHSVGYVKTVREQVVAANFDYVFVMLSLNHDLNVRRLERYLTLAWQSGAIPVVVLTKVDIAEGYEEMLKTIVLLGSSGVGKSSLVNALAGNEVMAVREIREEDSRGRHTTTHRQLLMLPNGTIVIDTPGMRELGMWEVSEGLGEVFADVEKYIGDCKFSDCRHETEPGCAVKAAIESGELSLERWKSYFKIKHEAKFTADRSVFLRDKDARNKEHVIKNRQKKHKERKL